jgi:hypothetical protein
VIFADYYTVAAVDARAPILYRLEFLELIKLSDILKTLIYELPGTLTVRPDFAPFFARAATGTIEQSLSAPGNRTYPAKIVQHT